VIWIRKWNDCWLLGFGKPLPGARAQAMHPTWQSAMDQANRLLASAR
jgi:hypothetical protein